MALSSVRSRFPFLVLGMLLLSAFAADAAAREVRVAVYENQPKVFTDAAGAPSGIFPDIIRAIAEREGWTLRFVPGTWPECLERLEAGEIDLMVDIAYSAERARRYDFCREDVLSNWAQVYLREGLEADLITDLAGRHVATLERGIHLERFRQLAEGFGFDFELTTVDSYDAVFRLLHEKRADAGVVNRVFGYTHERDYDVVRSPIVFSPASLRFAVAKGRNGDLIAAVDRRLADMKERQMSAYHQTLRRWLGETTKLRLPAWVVRVLVAAAAGILLLFAMSVLLKHQVDRKTEHLRLANSQLETQVSETMKAHVELKRHEEMMIRQERLGALGRLTSGISHDFNNMLTPILGYADLLLESPEILESSGPVREKLESIRSSAETARATVKRLQEFNRADAREIMETVVVADLVSEIVTATRPMWKSQTEARSVPIRVIENVPADLRATVSRAQYSEALMNLLINALHALPEGGDITIAAFARDGLFHLEVSDTGTGMTPEVAQQCLEPFFSTKGSRGTGMGLAMVHGIVERHNGTLAIDSAPGAGTTVSLRIPLEQRVAKIEPAPDAAAGATGALSVLVVDDDVHARTLLSECLRLDGHEVTVAEDTARGIALFDGGGFDLVVTDRAMPDASGDELARHVMNSERAVPVLMVTGFAQVMASSGERPAGVAHILGKPFTGRELRAAVAAALRAFPVRQV